METKHEAWKEYKRAVLERISDFSELFGDLKNKKPSGNGWVTACCPFHNDKNPSFAYEKHSGRWACFSGCGKGGAFDFLMHSTGASFKETLLTLGDKLGVPRPHSNGADSSGITETEIRRMAESLWKNEKVLRYLREKRGLKDETIRKYELGWNAKSRRISIPIRDEERRPVNIRFYSPSQKPKIMNTKGHGNPPRLYGLDELAKQDVRQVILCEGEFDRLILEQNGFKAVTSTHGCTSFRKEWLPFFQGRHVVVIYDCDPEGQAAVEGIVLKGFQGSAIASIKNVRLPLQGAKDDKDITDFFTKVRPMDGSLFEKRSYTVHDLQRLINEAPAIDLERFTPAGPKSGSSLLSVINSIRDAEHLKSHQRFISIGELIADHLSSQGAFYFDPKSAGEFLCLDGQLYTIGNNRSFNSLLQRLGRFNIATLEGRFVWEFLRNFAREKGSPVKSAGWVYGDPAQPAIYVHTHDDKGRILKISAKAITLIPNGQNEERLMLNPSDRVQAFTYQGGADERKGWQLFRELLFESFPCSLADRALLASVIPLIFLKDFCPAKPLLRLSGSSDSGKTTAAKLIGYLIYGEDIAKTGTIASFYTDASRNPLAMLDNLEVPNLRGELLDFLLTGATGIVHEKKKLYTDQEIVREKAISFIMTTGIESLGKPELLSRQWEIACDSAHHNPAFSQGNFIARILKNRDLILSAVFKLLAEHVLPHLGERYAIEQLLKREFKDHPKDRTFECLSMGLLIWDALEERLGLEKDLWMKWLGSQKEESEETSTETNIILQFLNLFKAAAGALEQSVGHQARDQFLERFQLLPETRDGASTFETTAAGILQIFTGLAKQHGYPRPFENARQLMARLKESQTVLEKAGWEVRLSIKVVRGDRIHWFRLPANASKQGGLPGVDA